MALEADPIHVETALNRSTGPYQNASPTGSAASEKDDERFIRSVVTQNPDQGVELLYRKYFQNLCSHAIKYVGSKSVAEDLVSEVFYEFYQANTFAQINTSYRYYLYRSVRNRAFDFLKKDLRVELLEERHDVAFSEGNGADAVSEFEEMYQDVQNAVNALPLERRRIYLMNKFDGKRYQEIADELKLSVKTVETQIYRANKFVRSLLKNKWLVLVLACFGG